jgi:threonine-phosphate decarboxylase
MTEHGGNIYEIEKFYNINKDKIVDFSSNINPLGLSKKIKKKIVKNFNIASRYPDIDYIDLKKSISSYYNINFDDIIVGNGGTELIFSIVRELKPKKSLILSPTFSEYEKALKVNNLKADYFRLNEKNDFYPDLNKFRSVLRKKYDCVFICNPNNPTGVFLKLDEIKKIIHECNKNKSMIFIDESFIDFTGYIKNDSAMNVIKYYNNIIILHSLTKFLAIPGLRLGFAVVSNKNLKKNINNKIPPWSVNSFSEIIGINMLNDKK